MPANPTDDATMMSQDTDLDSHLEQTEVGASLPTPEEIRTHVNPQPAKRGKGPIMIMFLASVVIALVFSIGLGVGLSNKNQASSSQANQAMSGPRLSTVEQIQNYVIAKNMSDFSAFDDVTSPQSRAASWMANIDKLNMAIPASPGANELQFIVRYVMTVFYYSTGGENWLYQFGFLSKDKTCFWNGLLLDGYHYIPYGFLCTKAGVPVAIHLDFMQLTGEVPSELSALTTLVGLDLNFNGNLAGTFPSTICQMGNLQSLAIGFTNVQGSIPTCINRLGNLTTLFLSNANLNGTLPDISNLVNLNLLYLDSNNFEGDVSSHFDKLVNLQELVLEENNFSGSISSKFMPQSKRLQLFDLSNNNFRGEMPVHLLQFENLTSLDLSSNNLFGSLPEFPMSSVKYLAIQNNSFTGSIPGSIQNLTNLVHLDLSSNNFTGTIILQLGFLTSLDYLFLAGNPFTPGPIPDTFRNLTKLEEFSVKRTSRNGTLPTFISTWKNLHLLDLAENQFVGTVPSEYGNLTNLEFLLLNYNNLQGTVPTSFGKLSNLHGVFLEDTNLQGDLAVMCAMGLFNQTSGDFASSEILVADCDGGPIQCSCCLCCKPGVAGNLENKLCNDNGLIASLNLRWESDNKRVRFNFGNSTRFTDTSYMLPSNRRLTEKRLSNWFMRKRSTRRSW